MGREMWNNGPRVNSAATMNQTKYETFVQCALGLESVVRRELLDLGWKSKSVVGGVELRVDALELAQLCLLCRSAESVRVRLKTFKARDFDTYKAQLKKLPFRAYLPAGCPVRVRVVSHHSQLWHSGAVTERTLEVLVNHVGCTDGVSAEPFQQVHVRLEQDEVQVSLDAGGAHMHRRGYRPHVERASLRETLAFALVYQALCLERGERPRALWDPFCGAGTIALEVAHLKDGRLARDARGLSLARWRGSDVELIDAATRAAKKRAEVLAQSFAGFDTIWGSDQDARALAAAKHNAQVAGLKGPRWLHGAVGAASEHIPKGALVVTNPPYGKRLSDCSWVESLLQLLRQRPDLDTGLLLVGGAARDLLPQEWSAQLRTKNGGLSVSARAWGLAPRRP